MAFAGGVSRTDQGVSGDNWSRVIDRSCREVAAGRQTIACAPRGRDAGRKGRARRPRAVEAARAGRARESRDCGATREANACISRPAEPAREMTTRPSRAAEAGRRRVGRKSRSVERARERIEEMYGRGETDGRRMTRTCVLEQEGQASPLVRGAEIAPSPPLPPPEDPS
jgi:hypothetical protein